MPANTVSVTRPGPFGNPWTIEVVVHYAAIYEGRIVARKDAPAEAVDLYRALIEDRIDFRRAPVAQPFRDNLMALLPSLRGKNLACFCAPDQPCHADVLLEVANRERIPKAMIFGKYPCCEGPLSLAMPQRTPAYVSEACPHCGVLVWHRLSRVESMSWTQSDFLDEHDVDLERKTITPKPGTDAARFEESIRLPPKP